MKIAKNPEYKVRPLFDNDGSINIDSLSSDIYGKERKYEPGHGFWIDTIYSYREDGPQIRHCSVCGRPSARPSGEYCKWCGAHLDQKPLDLTATEETEEETKNDINKIKERMKKVIDSYELYLSDHGRTPEEIQAFIDGLKIELNLD